MKILSPVSGVLGLYPHHPLRETANGSQTLQMGIILCLPDLQRVSRAFKRLRRALTTPSVALVTGALPTAFARTSDQAMLMLPTPSGRRLDSHGTSRLLHALGSLNPLIEGQVTYRLTWAITGIHSSLAESAELRGHFGTTSATNSYK